jgi:GT2 family glycosyltransferase
MSEMYTEHDALDVVTIVVVTYNSAHCLPSLGQMLKRCRHVVVVDNASHDDTAVQAAEHIPQAQILALPRNLGFGAANNRALAAVATPFALLLNPDCEIHPADMAALVEVAEQVPEAAIVAPQLSNEMGRPELNYRWPSVYWKSQGPEAEGLACVGFVCGACMLLRRSAFEGLGFFDEDFFLYYEDDDLCLRLFKARRPLVLAPTVRAVHRSRGSVRGSSPLSAEYLRGYHHAQSKLLFSAKHLSWHQASVQRRLLLISTTLVLPLRAIFFSPRLLARMCGRWRGLLDWAPRPH